MDTVTVPAETVIYAVRYCLPRLTSAADDARRLLRSVWRDLPDRDRVVILRDIDRFLADEATGLFPPSTDSAREWLALRNELET